MAKGGFAREQPFANFGPVPSVLFMISNGLI